MAVNSLAIAKRLQAAERENRAAEEIALVFQELQDANLQQVATREFVAAENVVLRGEIEKARTELHGEIEKLRAEMYAEFAKLRLEHKADYERLKHEMTMRMGAMLAAVVAVLGGLNVFF